MVSATPYYDLVPKSPIENLRWRIRCRERALEDKAFRDALWQACMDDVCFWMAFACWGYDPRAKNKIQPFIPHPHQEAVFVAMDEAIDRAEREERSIDVVVDKARAQGGTFGYLWVDLRRWLRDPMFSAGYVTRNEDLVDSKTDSNTVMWKIAWAIERLPVWMQPQYERHLGQHSFTNKENGALLRGYSAGQDVAAGGRATVFTIDEAGARDFVAAGKDEAVQESLHDVTNCAAEGTLVATDRGPVPIEQVHIDDLVWDGTMWTSHGGCVFQGCRETISAYGIRLTPDHQVFTVNGWSHAIDRLDRAEVRLPDGYSERWLSNAGRKEGQCEVAMPVRLRRGAVGRRLETAERRSSELRVHEGQTHCKISHDTQHDGHANIPHLGQHGKTVCQPERGSLLSLWGPRDRGVRAVADVRELSGGHGGEAEEDDAGPEGQQWRLLPGELSLGNVSAAGKQQVKQSAVQDIAGASYIGTSCTNCGSDTRSDTRPRSKGDARRRTVLPCDVRREKVYDILNCGPRQAFTVIDGSGRPVLIHNCIRMVSARYVDQGVFHEACQNPDTAVNGVHLVLAWQDHPVHGKHSYVVRDGKPEAVKPEEQAEIDAYHKENPNLRKRLERKGFKYEGKVRSPWYDMRCLRPTSTPRLIASQLDRDPAGAVGKVFATDLLDSMKRKHCKKPVWQGQPVFDSETLKLTGLITRDDGPLKLWFKPGIDNMPPLGPFTAGADIASGGVGAYSSNSVLSALDDRTGEQVLEYTIKGLEPRPFARRVVGLCLWLRNALLGWEDSGVSSGFAQEVVEVIYYGNVFYRDVPAIGDRRKSRKLGWQCRDADKADMFEQMALAMENGDYTPRSEEMMIECGEYEWDGHKIIHAPTKNKGASDKNHADRAIAGGGCWMVFNTDNAGDKIDSSEENGQNPEYGSFLWREQQERVQAKSGSPAFGIRDVVQR